MPTEVAKVTDNFPPFVVSLSNPVLSLPKGMNRRPTGVTPFDKLRASGD